MVVWTIGLDFGTNSVRAVISDCETGGIVGQSIVDYPSGDQGILRDPGTPFVARQHPGDYIVALEKATRNALRAAKKTTGFRASGVVGIGVSGTGSCPIPVDESLHPLALSRRWRHNLAAQCWLWKDHSSAWEAAELTRIAQERYPQYLEGCAGVYSSEWWWAKLWHCARVAPDVFAAAFSWFELIDFIPALLSGTSDPIRAASSRASTGHRQLFNPSHGGWPDKAFLAALDPRLARLLDRLPPPTGEISEVAGTLSLAWAERLGLPPRIPIAMGQFDVHHGSIGSGVCEGRLIKIIGTSSCDYTIVKGKKLPQVSGVCGVIPAVYGPDVAAIEAGQPAVGDLLHWWTELTGVSHARLSREAARLRAGESGLLALDWNNGNRSVLNDQQLSGVILGQTLSTTSAEIYRALIEATAFSAKTLVDHLEKHHIPVRQIVCGGGVANKNPLLLQIYADILGRRIYQTDSDQVCAAGAAVAAAVSAGVYSSFPAAQRKMVGRLGTAFHPDPEARETYAQLFKLHARLHDGFGGLSKTSDLSGVMKELLAIKGLASSPHPRQT